MTSRSRTELIELLDRGLPAEDLARAALLVACEACPDLDPEAYLARLDNLASRIVERLPSAPLRDQLAVVGNVLFAEEGLRGDTDHYHDPRNSLLNEVLDRRRGLPITLAIVYLHVAWRAHLPVFGLGLPGHFMVGAREGDHTLYVDAFHGGRLLDAGRCRSFITSLLGDPCQWREEYDEPLSPWRTLTRLLYNLKGTYLRSSSFEQALWVQDLLVIMRPEDPSELRDRGLVRAQLCQYAGARKDLVAYLESSRPAAPDADQIERDLERIRRLQQMMN